MKHEATLEYTVPILREAVAGFWRRSVGVGVLIALAICAALLAYLLTRGDRSWVVGFVAAILFFAGLFIVALYFVHYRNAVRKLRDMGSPRATFTVSEEWFTVSSGAGIATLPWSSVVELWKFKRCWLLLFSKAQFMTLPLESLSMEMRAFVLERVAAAGGKADG